MSSEEDPENAERARFIIMPEGETFDGQEPVMSRAAYDLQVLATGHSASCGHPGFVPEDYLEHLDGLAIETTITAVELCTIGMWERVNRFRCALRAPVDENGWCVRCPPTSVALGFVRPFNRLTLESPPSGVPRLRREREYQCLRSLRDSAGSVRTPIHPCAGSRQACRCCISGAPRLMSART